VKPGETEIVPPAFEKGEGRCVLLGRERVPQKRQVLADQLFLEVDRVGADDRALPLACAHASAGTR
jgi:hypothetical protein